VLMVRSEPTAEASLAAILDRSRLGIAIAAMIRIIATTISNSINENPLVLFGLCMGYSIRELESSRERRVEHVNCTYSANPVQNKGRGYKPCFQ
jgi:hypothetical protein